MLIVKSMGPLLLKNLSLGGRSTSQFTSNKDVMDLYYSDYPTEAGGIEA